MGFARSISVFLLVLPLAFASGTPLASVNQAVSSLCSGLNSLLPVAAMMAIVLGGVIYAAGQMMGAETRARANVWATACLTGAIIAIMIAVVGPAVLKMMYGQELACGGSSQPPTGCQAGYSACGTGGLCCGGSTPKCCNPSSAPSCASNNALCTIS